MKSYLTLDIATIEQEWKIHQYDYWLCVSAELKQRQSNFKVISKFKETPWESGKIIGRVYF